MSDIQKIIKYLAIAFAIYLCVIILGAIVGVFGSFMFIFGTDKGISDNLERISIDEKNDIKEMDINIKGAHLIIEDSEEFYIETNNQYIKTEQNKEKINGVLKTFDRMIINVYLLNLCNYRQFLYYLIKNNIKLKRTFNINKIVKKGV